MRGRTKRHDRPVEWKIHIPQSLAKAINERLYDPLVNGPAYGARSKLTEKLYRDWLATLAPPEPAPEHAALNVSFDDLITDPKES